MSSEIDLTDKQQAVLEEMAHVLSDPRRSTVKTKEVAQALGEESASLSGTVRRLKNKGAIEPFVQTTRDTAWRLNEDVAGELNDLERFSGGELA
ncbi:hypothetical protein [Natrinema hispanicum]|nr:hypothetical protein [Natrinema hispanicum]